MAKKTIKRYKGKPKEMFAGGLIGAAFSIGSNIWSGQKAKEAEAEQQAQQFKTTLKQRQLNDESILDSYPVDGLQTTKLYAKGGDMGTNKLPLSNEQRLSSDTKKVVNAGTHESGNDVSVRDSNGNVKAKVENEEVILDGDKVLSERTGHADVAEGISGAKGELEKILNDPNAKKLDNREKNARKRTLSPLQKAIAKLDEANDANFATQEEAKLQQPNITGEQFALGGDLDERRQLISSREPLAGAIENTTLDSSLAVAKTPAEVGTKNGLTTADVVPYLDNIAALTRRTPKTPKPTTQEAASLDTTVDISGQLADIDQNQLETDRLIEQNTSNSNVEVARKARARVEANRERSRTRKGADSVRRELVNADRLNTQRTSENNARLEDEYSGNELRRNTAISDNIQANINNAVSDYRQGELDKALAAKDERATLAIMSQNAGSGANYTLALSGALDTLSQAGKQQVISGLEAAGRDTTAIKNKWKM